MLFLSRLGRTAFLKWNAFPRIPPPVKSYISPWALSPTQFLPCMSGIIVLLSTIREPQWKEKNATSLDKEFARCMWGSIMAHWKKRKEKERKQGQKTWQKVLLTSKNKKTLSQMFSTTTKKVKVYLKYNSLLMCAVWKSLQKFSLQHPG